MGGVGGGIREDSPYPDYVSLYSSMFFIRFLLLNLQ